MRGWLDRDAAVYPHDAIYPPRQDRRPGREQQRAVEMVTSQDTAIAAALRELGYT